MSRTARLTDDQPPGPGAAASTPARMILAGFACAAVVHLAAHATGAEAAQYATKPLLLPLLAAWVWARQGPRLLVVALLFGWGGDLALMSGAEGVFLLGMGSFALGHVCYLSLFRRLNTLSGPGRGGAALLGGCYALACAAVLWALWPGLEAGMRLPVAGYSILLATTAWAAAVALGARAGLGGFLFLVSDTLIGGGLSDWPTPPAEGVLIMATYIAAQYLLASAVLGRNHELQRLRSETADTGRRPDLTPRAAPGGTADRPDGSSPEGGSDGSAAG